MGVGKAILAPRPDVVNRDLAALNSWAKLGDGKKKGGDGKTRGGEKVKDAGDGTPAFLARSPKKSKRKGKGDFVDELDLRGRRGVEEVEIGGGSGAGIGLGVGGGGGGESDKENVNPEGSAGIRGRKVAVNEMKKGRVVGGLGREWVKSKL